MNVTSQTAIANDPAGDLSKLREELREELLHALIDVKELRAILGTTAEQLNIAKRKDFNGLIDVVMAERATNATLNADMQYLEVKNRALKEKRDENMQQIAHMEQQVKSLLDDVHEKDRRLAQNVVAIRLLQDENEQRKEQNALAAQSIVRYQNVRTQDENEQLKDEIEQLKDEIEQLKDKLHGVMICATITASGSRKPQSASAMAGDNAGCLCTPLVPEFPEE
jgi:BMFP domain-containing protein YqiC